MATLKNIIGKFSAFNADSAIQTAFEKAAESFTEENKKQLRAGYNKDGEKIGEVNDGERGYKNGKYAFKKYEMNPLPGLGNPDLFLTGKFYEGLTTTVQGVTLKVASSDEKNEKLTSKYPGIFGLGGKFKREFIDAALRPNFILTFHEQTGL